MKYSQPTGNRAIGRVANRRWSGNGLYCSRRGRDDYPAARPTHTDAKLFAWLLAPQDGPGPAPLVPATVRVRAR